jgi:hypothetical protein
MRKLVEKKRTRKEELELSFTINWSVREPEEIEKVVDQCWQQEGTGGDPWAQYEKLRGLYASLFQRGSTTNGGHHVAASGNSLPATDDSLPYIKPPGTDDFFQLELVFAEWMRSEEAIKRCLKWKHNLSALGLDGVAYCHVKLGEDPIIPLLDGMSRDCVEYRQVSSVWKCLLEGS